MLNQRYLNNAKENVQMHGNYNSNHKLNVDKHISLANTCLVTTAVVKTFLNYRELNQDSGTDVGQKEHSYTYRLEKFVYPQHMVRKL